MSVTFSGVSVRDKSSTVSLTSTSITIPDAGSESFDGYYIWICWPSRLSGTRSFWVGGFEETFTESTVNTTPNQSSGGYAETFKMYRSPNYYSNDTISLEIKSA